MLTSKQLIAEPDKNPPPHVVLLGAGASRAAFPNGDANGKSLPLMDELPEILGSNWQRLLKLSQAPAGNFEETFSWLRDQQKYEESLEGIENDIWEYFSKLKLPDIPTIYDYLVLGLRETDIIATFNRDPLLQKAYIRNRGVAKLPDIRFLHGCVSYATCLEHDVLGSLNEMCPCCNKPLLFGKLLFPDKNKDYTKNSAIKRDWDAVQNRLEKAFHLTIFGYSGPVTDFKARELLLNSWRKTPYHDFSHVEVIDIQDEEKLRQNWHEYFPHLHDMLENSFWTSSVAKWPRRIAKYKLAASFYGTPSESIGPYTTDSLLLGSHSLIQP